MESSNTRYELVSTSTALHSVAQRSTSLFCALDFETTSLRPADGRVRLVSLCNEKINVVVDFDQIEGGFEACAHLFAGGKWVVYNAGFELRWFIAAGQGDVACYDLANLRRAVLGGGNYSLKQIALWDLDEEISKEEQLSDWSAPELTQKQLDYAFADADVTWRLWQHWSKKTDGQRWNGFRMFNDMVPAVIEMEETGILLDQDHHASLVEGWEETQENRLVEIRKAVPATDVANVNSDAQWSDYFASIMPDGWLQKWPRTEKAGRLSMTTKTLRRLAGKCPGTPLEELFDNLADFKTISKYVSSFGASLIQAAQSSPDGRIRPRVNIGAARTGRFSTSGPNVQQVPRNRDILGEPTSVRQSFIASPGCALVSLDYSGIELRVLALLSADKQLLEDMVTGDVHAEVAAEMVGHKIDRRTKEGALARQQAKAVSFGIVYGAAAPGLGATMRTTVTDAQSYIDFWQARYPQAFQYRFDIYTEAERTRYIRTVDGGTIYMGKKADLPKCANYPVQRAALSVMARAIVRHKASLDSKPHVNAHILATIHDALIDESSIADADECLSIMREDMTQGYLDVFPDASVDRLVEGGIGPNWGHLN